MGDKRFFALNHNCILVKGVQRGALYDLESGNVFSVNNISVKALQQLAIGRSIDHTLKEVSVLPREELIVYLNKLEKLCLGKWHDHYIKKELQIPNFFEVLKFVLHLELTTNCNLRCIHCYNESGAKREDEKNNELPINNWEQVIKEAYEIGARRVQFIGGEPFLRRELMFKLIPYACNLGYKSLEVSSNGTVMCDSDFEFLKEYGADLALSFYSHTPQIHDIITTRKGSWQKTLNTIKKALRVGVPLRISIVKMKENKNIIKDTASFLKSLGIQNFKTSLVEPAGRACSNDSIDEDTPLQQTFNKPIFPKIGFNKFWRNRFWHNCFSEQICIGSSGNVYPCLAERKISYGSIKLASLSEILTSKPAMSIRTLNKDHIEVCRDCEYRYCCFDCRVRAKDFLDINIHAKPWWCAYDPYKGQWA